MLLSEKEWGVTAVPALAMFDLDGTLVDSVPDLAAAVDWMLRQLGREAAGEVRVRHWVGNGAAMLVRRALAGCFDGDTVAALTDADIAEPLALFLAAYGDHSLQRSCLYPGVNSCLQGLQRRGVKMAVVTNKPEQFVAPILQSLGIADYFELILGGDSLPQKKPHPLPLWHCLEHFGVEAERALMVGDSSNDILAAQAARVAVAAVTYGYNQGKSVTDYSPDWVVDSLEELVR